MNVKQLEKYPKLEAVLSPSFRNELKQILHEVVPNKFHSYLNIYSLFITLTECESNYTGLDILNSEEKLNNQLQSLTGFICSDIIELGKAAQYQKIRGFKKCFTALAKKSSLTITPISISLSKPTGDMLHCKQRFNTQPIDEAILDYYSGWTCQSKEGKQFNLHLAPFRDGFGAEMTNIIHKTICNYAKTQKATRLQNTSTQLFTLLNLLPMHCSTPAQLEHQLKPHYSVRLMEEVMLNYLMAQQIKNNDAKISIIQWRKMITTFTQCFIESGVFPPPYTEFIIPEWREPKNNQHSISVGGGMSEAEIQRWLVNIPLTIKDDQALEVIHHRLNQDLKHIRIKSHSIVECVKQRHQRNVNYIKNGRVKPLPKKGTLPKGFPIGARHLTNTVATFYHHGVHATSNYLYFLGYYGQSATLAEELNLPTLETLNAFVALLILEHPKITPAWLDQWRLFDKHGNQVGFFQSGKQWLIQSLKNRKGALLAQQEIILNSYSKSLVEALIEHTAFSRETLKKWGNNDYHFMLLSCSSATKEPRLYERLGDSLTENRRYHQKLALASFDPTPPRLPFTQSLKEFSQITRIHPTVINRLLIQSEAHALAQIVTPRAIRKSRGLQIYLETRSLRAVSEALGHANVDTKLLGKYLPAPLMDFFNTRWVRQFQNAIIYEALKDSPYLFDALDFDERKLAEFLDNHGLGILHDHLIEAKEQACLTTTDKINELVFTLSTPLFQVLIALQQVTTNAHIDDTFKPEVEKWIEVAEFILCQFSTTGDNRKLYNGDKECEALYSNALANPLPLALFKESLLCR
ncbi:hypothetical protein FB443_11058 [Vibrio crassostreae]|uniref:hypothetical protein n=1 Tax=Vibrio TaxID=662 RepID=UPI001154F02B|nr:hypothetical protein [Vibrio crassostreae]TQL30721.1 hypothetical protein FB443_11058 [Vibrio crassostreae]